MAWVIEEDSRSEFDNENPFLTSELSDDVELNIRDADLALPLHYPPPYTYAFASETDQQDVFVTRVRENGDRARAVDGEDDGEEDMDMDMDDDSASDTSSNLTEIEEHEFPEYFKQVGGRLFHSHGRSKYPFPVDGPEWKRFDAIHRILRLVVGRNYEGPVGEVLADDGSGQKKVVVDLCTGTGLWTMEMAGEFPNVEFRGLDVVPITTRYPLDNVRFEMADVNRPLRFRSHSVDLVHARMTCLAIEDYPALFREIARVLRPGGLFLFRECGAYPVLHPSHPQHADLSAYIPDSTRFAQEVLRPMNGEEVDIPALIRATNAFTSPVETRRALPIGTPFSPSGAPPPSDGMKHLGEAMRLVAHGFAASVAAAAASKGPREEGERVAALAEGFRREVDAKAGIVSVWNTVWARKV